MVDAIADIHIETPWRTKQGFVLGRPTPIAVAGGVVLGIRLSFNDHAPEQAAVLLAFHQQAADEVVGDQLSAAEEEAAGESWGILGSPGGYRSGL